MALKRLRVLMKHDADISSIYDLDMYTLDGHAREDDCPALAMGTTTSGAACDDFPWTKYVDPDMGEWGRGVKSLGGKVSHLLLDHFPSELATRDTFRQESSYQSLAPNDPKPV